MPLLTAEFGFKQWYFDQLPDGLRAKAEKFVAQQLAELFEMSSKKLSNEERQYYFPLGMNVECELIYDLPQMVYVAELRSGETVHPTLRWVAQQMASTLSQNHPRLALYADMSESSFCIKRGAQDIVDRSDYGSIEKERNLSMTSA
jgi:hypothetical protein